MSAQLEPPVPPLSLGIVLYPGFTLLDLAGPQSALGLHGQTHLFSKSLDPVMSDSGVALVPTTTFAGFDGALDILMVPGGFGTNDAMCDAKLIDFLARTAPKARYVTSVCSGSLILGMAGLLDGHRAATHWALYEALEAVGATPVHERVVIDRNRITGGGVTAGIDFGLRLLAELRGDEVAKMTQLMMEYDPEPPFDTGHPRTCDPALVAAARAAMGDEMTGAAVQIARSHRVPEPA